MKRATLLAGLTLVASLPGCAPAYTAGGTSGQIQFAQDVFSRGSALELTQVRPDTPPNQFVRLPDCEAVAYWGDIQRVGLVEAGQQCLHFSRGVGTLMGGVVIIGFLLLLPVLYFFGMMVKALGELTGSAGAVEPAPR